MKSALLLLLLVVNLAGGGCSTKSKSPYRAFQQQDEADLVVEFWHWDSWAISKPAITDNKHLLRLSKQEFLDKLSQLAFHRHFVVVIFDKREAPAGKGASMDELESFFRGLGFQRMVFQQAVSDWCPDGLPILRDSASRL
jgi:hypothetical protein